MKPTADVVAVRLALVAGLVVLVATLWGCGVLVPMCDQDMACQRGADGTCRRRDGREIR
jgi:hypothetical protein